jgi:hypothetical protein
VIDLPAVRALAERAKTDDHDGLTVREQLPDLVLGMAAEIEQLRVPTGPTKAALTRQLRAAGHRQWAGKYPDERRVPGFRVAVNPQITPGGIAVLHMAQFDDAVATETALNAYAASLRALGYNAEVRLLVGSLRGVCVSKGSTARPAGIECADA